MPAGSGKDKKATGRLRREVATRLGQYLWHIANKHASYEQAQGFRKYELAETLVTLAEKHGLHTEALVQNKLAEWKKYVETMGKDETIQKEIKAREAYRKAEEIERPIRGGGKTKKAASAVTSTKTGSKAIAECDAWIEVYEKVANDFDGTVYAKEASARAASIKREFGR